MKDLAAYAKSQKTTGLIVVQDGRTLIEENWPLPTGSEQFVTLFARGATSYGALREDVASQQKSLIALLAGIAIDRSLIDIALPVSSFIGEGWTKALPDQERAITVRHLLEMTSGLKESLEVEAPAGTKFFYNTPAYTRLQRVLEVASGQKLDALTREWLTAPLGMTDTEWRPRPAGLAQASRNAWGLETAPRDLVKLGALVLERGKGLISEKQLDAIFTPTDTNPAYGRLWWLNNGAWWIDVTGERHDGKAVPDAPADLVQGLGAHGRILGVVPSRKLVVVRFGQQPTDADFRTQFWQRVMATL